MIPLHLRCTTVAVTAEHAALLVTKGLAEWIAGGRGLVAKAREDAVLAALS
jgi:hypothetical protein